MSKNLPKNRREALVSSDAVSVGPYSMGVRANGFVFLSGQTPLDPVSGKLVEGGIEAQTRQCMENLSGVLKAGGLSLDDVQKVNVFLTDMQQFDAMNKVYAAYFSAPYPARTTIGVAALPLGAEIEIEMIAVEGD